MLGIIDYLLRLFAFLELGVSASVDAAEDSATGGGSQGPLRSRRCPGLSIQAPARFCPLEHSDKNPAFPVNVT